MGVKLFISADIEGCGGITLGAEAHGNEAVYARFAREMTDEVVAVCEAAREAGAGEIVVKDGHGAADNIDPFAMPRGVTLIRGKSGHPFNMMFGLDSTFDAVLFLGYHAPAGDPGSPLAHTSTGESNYLLLNGERMSEFLLNAYSAAYCGKPVIFLSGDQAICDMAERKIPGIVTVASKRGYGAAAANVSRPELLDNLRAGVKKALAQGPGKIPPLPLPRRFTYQVNLKDLRRAYRMSFYPGMKQLDPATLELQSDDWMDIVTAHSFVVY
ncbi:MAG: M55 family metallopeptidase [Treponema sp.]|jgi:D-amino peptidase|nr:M55 family metallopeptidase [Treponema sp.]